MAGKAKNLLAALLLVLAAGCNRGDEKLDGYVEGEYVRIGPTTGGILLSLSVERGAAVQAGQDLFSIDLTALTARRDADKALLSEAQAKWADLTKGKRPEEIEVITQQRSQAAAELDNARKEYERSAELAKKDAASVKQRDEDKAAYERAAARVAEMEADLKVAVLGAREDELASAKAAVDAAAQKVTEDEKLLREGAPKAPAAGQIEDTFYRPGEFVQAGSPVVSLLPPENVKIRFFVPEKHYAAFSLGEHVTVHCDGCPGPVAATITFLASQAEFTPPVIYSVESRDKLVFMIEAKPDKFEPALKPGLPVDVEPSASLQKTP